MGNVTKILTKKGPLGEAFFGGGGSQAIDTTAQRDAAERAIALQERMYEEGLERSKPFYEAGVGGLTQLQALLGMGGEDTSQILQADPSYQFRVGEGEKALQRQLAAQGKTMSPEAVKALQSYGQQMGSQEYSNAYNRLANLAGIGQAQTGAMQQAGQVMAHNVGQTEASLADALVAAQQAQNQQRKSMFGSAGALLGGGLGFMAGGPMGAMAGSQIGGSMGGMF